MQTTLTILNEAFTIECAAPDQRRVEDLAYALEQRLTGFTGDIDGKRRLILAALSLLDEAQAANAALVRARCEIERLTDMLVEAQVEAEVASIAEARGRLGPMRA